MRGGKRTGSGRPKGVKNRPRLRLAQTEQPEIARPKSAKERMAELQADVAIFRGAGLSDDGIAAALEITADELRALFPRALANGAALSRTENLALLRRSAAAGSVSAQRAIEAVLTSAMTAPSSPTKLGKKDMAAARSQDATVGTAWEGLAPSFAPPVVPETEHVGEQAEAAKTTGATTGWEELMNPRRSELPN